MPIVKILASKVHLRRQRKEDELALAMCKTIGVLFQCHDQINAPMWGGLAEQTLQEEVLHRMYPQDLALQPGSITVTSERLKICFETKPLQVWLLHPIYLLLFS